MKLFVVIESSEVNFAHGCRTHFAAFVYAGRTSFFQPFNQKSIHHINCSILCHVSMTIRGKKRCGFINRSKTNRARLSCVCVCSWSRQRLHAAQLMRLAKKSAHISMNTTPKHIETTAFDVTLKQIVVHLTSGILCFYFFQIRGQGFYVQMPRVRFSIQMWLNCD